MGQHLTDLEMYQVANGKDFLDKNNNMDSEFVSLAQKVNRHIDECSTCKKRYFMIKEELSENKDKVKLNDEEKHGTNEQKYSIFSENEDKNLIENTMNLSNFIITTEMIEYYKENPDELENSNYTSAQKEAIRRSIRREMQSSGKQLTLVNNSRGYADALILALITGFAGGLFLSIILTLCK